MIAICSHFNRLKGFGFAIPANEAGQPDNTQPDIFVHAKNITNRKFLIEGDLITYDIGAFQDRPVAVNVKVITPVPLGTKVVSDGR